MIREGTLDDIPRAAAMRQRAWPESIVTEEGMRHHLAAVPVRAAHAMFAFEEGGAILGWATSSRSWWQPGPDAGILSVSVDPSRSPQVDPDASLVALVAGELAGMTMIRVDRPSGRAQNNLCGVRRRHRGRGLALLLKSHSLRCTAELGATIALTDNDESNAPMLAVNSRLGYRPYARRLEWERSVA